MNKLKAICLSIAMLSGAFFSTHAQDTVVFSQDFSNGTDAQDWTMNDANSDGITWETTPTLNGIAYNGIVAANDAEDWLFTPAFSLESGKHYLVSYTVSQRGAFEADNVSLFYGSSATPEAMSNKMTEESYNNHSGMVTRFCHIAATQSGTFNIGLKLVSKAGNGIIVVKAVSVTETTGQCPQPALAMDASSSAATQTVKVRWINPKKDTGGAALAGNLNALVYQDDQLIATVPDMIPGEKGEYSFAPESFSGKHLYSVAFEADEISEKTSEEVDLDDMQGTIVSVYSFPLSKKTDFSTWIVENTDGGVTWTYDYGSVYMSAFGKAVNDWLITPGYELEPGKRYILTYQLKSGLNYPASLDVTFGNTQTAAGQTNVITTYQNLEQNGYGDYTSPQFNVTEAGTYYFAFHATYIGNSLDVRKVTLNYIEVSGDAEEEVELTYTEPAETVTPDNVNGDLTATTEYHQRISMEGVELRAAFTQSQLDEYTMAPNGIFDIEYSTKVNKYGTNLDSPILTIDLAGGCTYHNGRVYCNQYNSQGNIQQEVPVWKILDAKTFEEISSTTLNSNCENTTITLVYDPTTDKIFGFVKDYIDTWLVEINPENGSMTRLAPNAMDYWKRFLTMGCDQYGNLYTIYMTEDNVTGDQKHYLARVNKENGQISDLGEITATNLMHEDILVNMKYRQALFFDNSTGKMYWFMCSSSLALGGQYAALFEVNPVNSNAMLLTWLTDVYAISGAYFEEPAMQAPGVISDFVFTNDAVGATTGTISFKIPETSYNGAPMASQITYTVKEENGINLEGTATAGETVQRAVSSSQGIHNLDIQLSNEAGVGPVAKRTFLIGFDMPVAPENVVLTDTALTTTLRWNTPSTGVHGQVYDKSKLTYEVVRYPEELTVAQGITDTVFVEDHGVDLLRYYYVIYSCIDGERSQGVVSNPVVVGEPLYPPYGGVFTTMGDMYNYYTILDINNDGYTWMHDASSGAAFYPYNWQQAANDWLISPPIRYDKGAEYLLTFSAFSSSELYPESLLVTFGDGKTPESQTIQLLDIPEVPEQEDDGTITTYQLPITAPETGVFHYGFKVYSKAYQDYLFLYYITLEGTTGVKSIKSEKRNFDAYAQDGFIKVLNPNNDTVSIYNINGVMIEQSTETGFNAAVTPGIYVVKSSTAAIKVAVK